MEIIEVIENPPAAWPELPEGFTLSTAAAALSPGLIWSRIEAYTAHRWSEREATWLVEGAGCFSPTLAPAEITATERWDSPSWVAVELAPGPRGLILPGGTHRITATVGAGATVPAAVSEAFKRLAEYWATPHEHKGASRFSVDAGPVSLMQSRDAAWVAKAMDLSGAADLLRAYRRA